MPEPSTSHFDVHPSVVFKLGEELITDSVQALLELIKNSYDADASVVTVEIDTTASAVSEDGDELVGRVRVKDNGIGMTADRIDKGWFVLSASEKRQMKIDGVASKRYVRVPLGDKGLGRLGAQRLGRQLTISTFPDPKPASRRRSRTPVPGLGVTIDWEWFATESRLSSISAPLLPLPPELPGTELLIWGLNDLDEWRGLGKERLRDQLSLLISPVSPPTSFTISIVVDGEELELSRLSEEVRSTAQARWRASFDGESLVVSGELSAAFFRPNTKEAQTQFHELVLRDGGVKFFKWLQARKGAGEIHLSRPTDSGRWFAAFGHETDFARVTPDSDTSASQLLSPGPFEVEMEVFSLDAISVAEQHVYDRAAQFKAHMKRLSGIRIYRDGFGVRTDGDWLKLGRRFSAGSSAYQIKIANVVGFVSITALGNQQLVETTDREGFVVNPAFQGFLSIVGETIQFANQAQGFIGRGFQDYQREKLQKASDVPTSTPASALSQMISTALAESDEAHSSLKAAMAALATVDHDDETVAAARAKAIEAISLAEGVLAQLSTLAERAKLLELEVADLTDRLRETMDVVSVGLSAEMISHELTNVVSRLTTSTNRARDALRKRPEVDPEVSQYVEDVAGAIRGVRKQLAHLNPSLRYAREQRSNLVISEYLSGLLEYYSDRWKKREIGSHLTVLDDFQVRMNEGKLTQIMDNLLMNSEYWIEDGIQRGVLSHGFVTIEVDRPWLRVYDDGPGVDPLVEETLFDPFVTRKAAGVGRGLGLYVAAQLADSEGAGLELLQERNLSGRRFVFQLDLDPRVVQPR